MTVVTIMTTTVSNIFPTIGTLEVLTRIDARQNRLVGDTRSSSCASMMVVAKNSNGMTPSTSRKG